MFGWRSEPTKDKDEKALDARDAIDELNESVSKLYEQRFQNVVSEFEGYLSVIEHEKNMLEEFISQSEAKGYVTSTEYYKALQENEKLNIDQLKQEKASLLSSLQTAVDSGAIEKYSESWYNLVGQIDEVTLKIEEGETAILEYANSIREIEWSVFDMIQEQISNVTKEADFLIELMSNKKLYDDKGQLTDEGKATMGLHGMNYNTNMYQADKYGEEIKKIDESLKTDPYDQELIKRRQELLELQQESILNAEDEKNAIKDMVEEGIEKELDSLDELIDKYTDALDSQKELYEFSRKLAKQTKEIADLEKQMASLRGDDSEETKAKVQELKVKLEESKADLEEMEYDQYISDQKQLLDDLYLEYETILNARLDNIDALITDMITEINSDAGLIKDTITSSAENVGYQLSDTIKQSWDTSSSAITNGITNVITKYGDGFTSAMTTTNNALSNISLNIINMIKQLNKLAKTDIKAAGDSSASGGSAGGGIPSVTPPKPSGNGDGTPKVGDKVTFVSGSYYYDSYGTNPLGSMYHGQSVYITNINPKGSHPYHISTGSRLGSGDLGWLKLNQISGYATGKKRFASDEVAWTQENGREMIVRPSDNAILTPIAKGDSVLDATASGNIWDMANDPSRFIKDNLGIGDVGEPIGRQCNTTYTQNLDKVVFNLPNVKNYDQMLSAMQKDRNFERLIMAMTVDRIAGGSALAKGKSIR